MKSDSRFKLLEDVHVSGKSEKGSANSNVIVQGVVEDMTFQNNLPDAQDRSKNSILRRRRNSYKIDVNER